MHSDFENDNVLISSKDGGLEDSNELTDTVFVESFNSSHQRLTATNSDVENSNIVSESDGHVSPLKTSFNDDILVAA